MKHHLLLSLIFLDMAYFTVAFWAHLKELKKPTLHISSRTLSIDCCFSCRRRNRCRFDPWVRRIPWRRAWQPTPVFLPGESHGQRSLAATVRGVAQSRTGLSASATRLRGSYILASLCASREAKSISRVRLCDPMDCSLPGSSIHGIFQARVLEWVAISFSRDLPDPGIKPGPPALQADALPSEPPGKPYVSLILFIKNWVA